MAWWPNGMEVQCPVAVACGLSLGDGHCTFDNPYPDERPHYRQPRCYRKPHRHSVWPKNACVDSQVRAETDQAGGGSRGRTRQTEPQTRKGTGYREARSSVTPYTCETEIPFGPQMSGHSDNARLSARTNVFGMAWWPKGMEVRYPVAFAHAGCRWVTATAHSVTPHPNEQPHYRQPQH